MNMMTFRMMSKNQIRNSKTKIMELINLIKIKIKKGNIQMMKII